MENIGATGEKSLPGRFSGTWFMNKSFVRRHCGAYVCLSAFLSFRVSWCTDCSILSWKTSMRVSQLMRSIHSQVDEQFLNTHSSVSGIIEGTDRNLAKKTFMIGKFWGKDVCQMFSKWKSCSNGSNRLCVPIVIEVGFSSEVLSQKVVSGNPTVVPRMYLYWLRNLSTAWATAISSSGDWKRIQFEWDRSAKLLENFVCFNAVILLSIIWYTGEVLQIGMKVEDIFMQVSVRLL